MFSMLLLALFFVALSSAQPVRIAPVIVNGAGDSSACPSTGVLESARRNISEDISSLFDISFLESLPACGEGDWIQVAILNTSDESQQCPSPWIERPSPTKSCSASVGGTCQGVTFPVPITYSRICGRITGYGVRIPDAFFAHRQYRTIDLPYVDGVSVTHGSPRQHIWSLAAGHGGPDYHCPCDNADRVRAPLPPSFVGDNWFCDHSENGALLWDGRNCNTDCCTFNTPPWFNVTLPTITTDSIEVRICADEDLSDEQVQLNLIELFVQ